MKVTFGGATDVARSVNASDKRLLNYYTEMDRAGKEVMGIVSEDMLHRLTQKPDLIIQMDAKFIMEGRAPCPNVLWAIDNHVAPYGSYETFDKLFGFVFRVLAIQLVSVGLQGFYCFGGSLAA